MFGSPRLLGSLALGTACYFGSISTHAEQLNILWFGNSFSVGVKSPLTDLAQAAGYNAPNILAAFTGGQDFLYHTDQVINTPSANVDSPLPSGETWDVVIMQGHSQEATDYFQKDYQPPVTATATIFTERVIGLYNAVSQDTSGKAAGARTVLYQTWAYHPNHNLYDTTIYGPVYVPFKEDAYGVQEQIRGRYDDAAATINQQFGVGTAVVAGVGDAFEASGFDVSLYRNNGEDHHPTNKGEIFAAMGLFRTIFGQNVTDIDFNELPTSTSSAITNTLTSGDFYSLATLADDTITIPEPNSLALLSLGGLLMVRNGRRLL